MLRGLVLWPWKSGRLNSEAAGRRAGLENARISVVFSWVFSGVLLLSDEVLWIELES